MPSKAYGEITYPFAHGWTVDVLDWNRNFIPYFIMDAITYSCWGTCCLSWLNGLGIPCNCPQVNATKPHWMLVNTGLSNGLVRSDNQPLPESLLTQISIAIWGHQATMCLMTCGYFLMFCWYINFIYAPRSYTGLSRTGFVHILVAGYFMRELANATGLFTGHIFSHINCTNSLSPTEIPQNIHHYFLVVVIFLSCVV